MSTFINFTITVPFADFSAENWEALVRDNTNPENTSWDEIKMLMLQNAYWGITHTLKNYVDQVLNGAINHYNGALTITYNRIATLEAEVTHLWEELTRFPRGNITSKAKVPELPTFAGSKNKMHLYDWLSQIALYCLVFGIIADDQKIVCALTRLCAPAVTPYKCLGKISDNLHPNNQNNQLERRAQSPRDVPLELWT